MKVRTVSYFLIPFIYAGAAGLSAQDPIDLTRAARYLAEARALAASPAYPWAVPSTGSLLLVDRATRFAVSDRPDPGGVLHPREGVYAGTLPDGLGIANTAFDWGDQRWTMVVWPLPDGRFARARLVAHELFHGVQPPLGIPMANPSNAHLEHGEARLWLRLEMRALGAALADGGSTRADAVRDALLFRSARHVLHAEGVADERALELNEGLAEYTGIRVAIPSNARAGWAVQRMETRESRADRESVVRSFAYVTGPAYGLLLDAARPDWHGAIDSTADLGVLLAEAYQIAAPTNVATAARARMAAYDGRHLEIWERERSARRKAEQEAYRARYVDGPTLVLPVDDQFGYSFDPNAVSVFDGFGQVLTSAEVRAGWGRLAVDGGVLLLRDQRGITGVVVPASDNMRAPAAAGDGWRLELNPGWSIVPGDRSGRWKVER